MPIFVDAATLTEYITPDDRFAKSNDGVAASTVMFVRIFDILWESNPLTITWKFFKIPMGRRGKKKVVSLSETNPLL